MSKQQQAQPSVTDTVIRIPPQQYIHVLDQNTNLTRLEIGPMTFVKKQNEKVLFNPTQMIQLQPRTFCKISDPIIIKDKKPVTTTFGQVKNRFGQFEIRTAEQYPDPFPLYPGENLVGAIEKQQTILQNTELRIVATRDFFDGKQQRIAGEEWQIPGPFTYNPKVEEQVVAVIKPQIIKPNQALRLKARRNLKDSEGNDRKVGEEWLIRTTGSYVPKVYEDVVSIVQGKVLTDQICLHLKATKSFTDLYKIARQAGEEWLITNAKSEVHIKDVFEEIVREEKLITLSSRDYCVILNPIDPKTKKNLWGNKILKNGETSFFLQPGEELLNNKVQSVNVLGEDEALLLLALQSFKDDEGLQRKTGEKWMILGPREYIPPIEVEILERRQAIPLDENEGIYIRNNDTGEVRSFTGQTYLLQAHESLWEKELTQEVEELLAITQHEIKKQKSAHGTERIDKQRVITYKAPHNSAVQLYNYKTKQCRVIFGPNQILLEPYENFTVLNLSGGCPKQENFQKLLALNLGPDFMTDKIVVETSDHAQISLQLAYNWRFKLDQSNQDDCLKIFSIPDFIGFACQTIASRIRGAVSSITFEDFHHDSNRYIQESVFGKDANNNIKPELFFAENNLQVTSVDIQNVSITDKETKDNLEKCLNLAIEIKAQSQEADSKHKAQKLDQESKGQLELDNLEFQIKKEEAKINLLKMEAQSKEVQMIGEAKAKAQASAQSELITIEAEVKQAEIRAKQMEIEGSAEIEQIKANQKAELENKKGQNELEIRKMQELADIEVKKFQQIVKAIGKDTLVAISKAGPEQRSKLLQGLGLKGYLITDGKNPINLFNTASGFMGDQNIQK